jgi:sensor histidine kinase YesM
MDRVVIGIWCIVSFTVSGFFVYHGVFLFTHEVLSSAQEFYAITGMLYGVYSAGLLVIALIKAKIVHEKLAKYGVTVMFLTQIVFIYINDEKSVNLAGIFIGLLIVLFMLSANWLSVKYVVKRRQYA